MKRIVLCLAAGTALFPGLASATVNQPPPGNEPMPQPVGATELAMATARGFPASALTLAGLFSNFNGGGDAALDPIASAQTTPGTFMPQCGLTASIVLQRGRLQHRARLVQRDRAGHGADGGLPDHPRRSQAGAAERDQLPGFRLLPARFTHDHADRAA